MISLLCAALMSAALCSSSVDTRVVTIQSARKCAALGEAERRNPGWEWVDVSPAEPGKTMNTAWVVTLKRN